MSLFPLTDIIPRICKSLSHADIGAIILVNRATSAHFTTRHKTVNKSAVCFTIIERRAADNTICTTTKWKAERDYHDRAMRTIQYMGTRFTGLVRLYSTSNPAIDNHVRIIYVKNNMAMIFSLIITFRGGGSNSCTSVCRCEHYMDIINLALGNFTEYFKQNAIPVSKSHALLDILIECFKPSEENDAKLIHAFEQADR